MKNLSETILERCRDLPEGHTLSLRGFSPLGSRARVGKAFSRLVMHEQMYRISRGLYVVPVDTRFGMRPPATDKVMSSRASKSNEVIAASGAQATNALGLTDQVPVQEMFFTQGRSQTLQLGSPRLKSGRHRTGRCR